MTAHRSDNMAEPASEQKTPYIVHGHTEMQIFTIAAAYLSMQEIYELNKRSKAEPQPNFLDALVRAAISEEWPGVEIPDNELEERLSVLLHRIPEDVPHLLREFANCAVVGMKERERHTDIKQDEIRWFVHECRHDNGLSSPIVHKLMNDRHGLNLSETRYKQMYREAKDAIKKDPKWAEKVKKRASNRRGWTCAEMDEKAKLLDIKEVMTPLVDIVRAHIRGCKKKRGKKAWKM